MTSRLCKTEHNFLGNTLRGRVKAGEVSSKTIANFLYVLELTSPEFIGEVRYKKVLKGTVNLILSNFPFKEIHSLFTTVLFKHYFYSAIIKRDFTILSS